MDNTITFEAKLRKIKHLLHKNMSLTVKAMRADALKEINSILETRERMIEELCKMPPSNDKQKKIKDNAINTAYHYLTLDKKILNFQNFIKGYEDETDRRNN